MLLLFFAACFDVTLTLIARLCCRLSNKASNFDVRLLQPSYKLNKVFARYSQRIDLPFTVFGGYCSRDPAK
jgi:hypothetical protein